MNSPAFVVSDIWFWQRIISPHMAELAVELSRRGFRVFCIASQAMSSERSRQGWSSPDLPGVTVHWIGEDASVRSLVDSAQANSIHLCQGIRENERIALAQRLLAKRGLRQWVVMETVDDAGLRGILKRFLYRYLFWRRKKSLRGVLAIGHRTAAWVASRGVSPNRVFPFAYFLPDRVFRFLPASAHDNTVFKFVFVGQLIARKRVDWLIRALAELTDRRFELWIVGGGAEELALKKLAAAQLGDRVTWLGPIAMAEVPTIMAQADCLVLPSLHDGWGAVCSEALMIGTPVIASDACGVSGVVKASGVGGVFQRDNFSDLRGLLSRCLDVGCVHAAERDHLAAWARALGAKAGASYLLEILNGATHPPAPPWESEEILSMVDRQVP